MKINKQFVQEVANGKYSDYDSHGEMQRAAQRILDEKIVSKFQKFCFRVYGKDMPDNVTDIYDAFVDFAIENKKKLVLIVPEEIRASKEVWFKGDSVDEVLKKLHEWAFFEQDASEIDGCTFQIEGDKRLYEFNGVMFHYCFDHGRMSVEELLEEVCYEE